VLPEKGSIPYYEFRILKYKDKLNEMAQESTLFSKLYNNQNLQDNFKPRKIQQMNDIQKELYRERYKRMVM